MNKKERILDILDVLNEIDLINVKKILIEFSDSGLMSCEIDYKKNKKENEND